VPQRRNCFFYSGKMVWKETAFLCMLIGWICGQPTQILYNSIEPVDLLNFGMPNPNQCSHPVTMEQVQTALDSATPATIGINLDYVCVKFIQSPSGFRLSPFIPNVPALRFQPGDNFCPCKNCARLSRCCSSGPQSTGTVPLPNPCFDWIPCPDPSGTGGPCFRFIGCDAIVANSTGIPLDTLLMNYFSPGPTIGIEFPCYVLKPATSCQNGFTPKRLPVGGIGVAPTSCWNNVCVGLRRCCATSTSPCYALEPCCGSTADIPCWTFERCNGDPACCSATTQLGLQLACFNQNTEAACDSHPNDCHWNCPRNSST